MSDLSVNSILDASGGATTTINGFTPTVSNMAGRNRIINGNFDIWQRGTSFTGNFYNSYGADRWSQGQYQSGAQSRQEVTLGQGPKSKYCMRVSDTTAEATRSALSQMVEHNNSIDLAGQTVTLSFWIRFSASSRPATSEFVYQLSEYDSIDPAHSSTGATRANDIVINNGSLPTVWTKYTHTVIVASTMKNIGARFLCAEQRAASSEGDFWYEIAEVQLEAGSVATPFEHRQYGQELALCQRYFQTYGGNSGNERFGGGFNYLTTQARIDMFLATTMRSTPTLTISSASHFSVEYGNGAIVCTAISLDQPSTKVVSLNCNVSSGLVQGQGVHLNGAGTFDARLNLSAEL